MYKAFVLIFVLFSTSLMASIDVCYRKLTYNNKQDSRTISFKADNYDWSSDKVGDSYRLIRKGLEQIGCNQNSIKFSTSPEGRGISVCQNIAKGYPNSLVCYIETNLGYFFITRDLLDSVNIIYNRWD